MRSVATLFILLLAVPHAGVLAQQQSSADQSNNKQSKTDKNKTADKDKSKDDKSKSNQSVFAGSYDTKSAKKTTDTATLGFKGVGPDGQVDPTKLGESPTGEDERIAQLMTGVKTNSDEAKVFVDNGKLRSK